LKMMASVKTTAKAAHPVGEKRHSRKGGPERVLSEKEIHDLAFSLDGGQAVVAEAGPPGGKVAAQPSPMLAELTELLADWPMDDEQRASVVANAETVPQEQVRAMIQRMRTTRQNLETRLANLTKLFPFGRGVEITANTTVPASYEISVPAEQKAECA
jgi:hypothetical protein